MVEELTMGQFETTLNIMTLRKEILNSFISTEQSDNIERIGRILQQKNHHIGVTSDAYIIISKVYLTLVSSNHYYI